jgi:serine/threonine-protein kinase HipA
MRQAKVFMNHELAGFLQQTETGYIFIYEDGYKGPPISLTLPVQKEPYIFEKFPPFFDGLLPEGMQLEGLLRFKKLDRHDYFGQLMCVGKDLVGAVHVEEIL